MQEDLKRARDLMGDGQYDEAHALLLTLDHPVAVKWVAKLEESSLVKRKRKQNPRQMMTEARQLIKDKQYHRARALLLKIDHPTAQVWLDKIEELMDAEAEYNTSTPASDEDTPTSPWLMRIGLMLHSGHKVGGVGGGVAVILGVLAVFGYTMNMLLISMAFSDILGVILGILAVLIGDLSFRSGLVRMVVGVLYILGAAFFILTRFDDLGSVIAGIGFFSVLGWLFVKYLVDEDSFSILGALLRFFGGSLDAWTDYLDEQEERILIKLEEQEQRR